MAAATWQQLEFVLDPLLQVQWWDTRRCSLEPRQRWLAPLGPTEMSSVIVCQLDLSLQLLWVGGRSSLMV